VPGQPAPRPIAGPILPLVASSVGTDQLLGGAGARPVSVDALAARTLVKGEALSPPAGRADDFAWPRREVGREQAKEPPKEQAKPDTPMAVTTPGDAGAGTPAPSSSFQPKQKRLTTPTAPGQTPPQTTAPGQAQGNNPSIRDFFGLGGQQQQPQKPAQQPRNPNPAAAPRPPGRAAVLDTPFR
jgi:hypothetical protein